MNVRFVRLTLSAMVASCFLATAQAQTPAQIAQADAEWNSQYQAALFWAQTQGWPTEVTLVTGQRGRLVRVDQGKPVYWFTRDRVASVTVSADKVWPGASSNLNLTGQGIFGGVWDIGTMSQHPEFSGRLTVVDSTGPDDHANQCGGAMGATGVNSAARGAAYQITLRSWDSNNDRSEVQAAAAQGMRVSNHSYGPVTGWSFGLIGPRWTWLGEPAISQTVDWKLGSYGQEARTWDEAQFNSPGSLIVVAAGNQRLDGPQTQPVEHDVFENGNWVVNSTTVRDLVGGPSGYDSLPPDATAKNPLIIGAVQKNAAGYTGPAGVRMSSFSVWGPTDDGRIKPDLVAPGVNLFMPLSNSGYGFADGTSFAAPVAAGVIGLFQQAYVRTFGSPARAATMKALAIHTADEAGDNPGPDYAFGWGQINALSGARHIQSSVFSPEAIQQRRLNAGQTSSQQIRVGSGSSFRVTLAWMDPAGTQQAAALNPRDRRLVNDLDLRVIHVATGTEFQPWRLDVANPRNAATRGDNNVDNVEQVLIDNPLPGNYIVRVTHKGSTLRPAGGQDYSLIITAPQAGGLQELSLNPSVVIGGAQSSFATVTLSETRAEPTVLQISTSNPTAVQIPTSVTIPPNQSVATFVVNSRSVQTTQAVRIFVGGEVGSVSADLEVRPVTIGNTLLLSQSEVVGGTTVIGTVTLSSPAPTGGTTVSLRSSASSIARPTRNWILIPAGQTTGQFNIQTSAVGDPRTVTISAIRGSVTATEQLRVVRPALISFTSPTTAGPNTLVSATVTLNGPAPSTGATVQLASSNRNIASVPSSVTVPPGARTVTFNIRTFRPSVATPVTITATRFGDTRQSTITVNP